MVVLCTAPDAIAAEKVARALLEARVAACVNVVPGVRSLYWWKGAVQDDTELLLVIKTRARMLELLEETIRANHPYEVPEILALPVRAGAASYLDWLLAETPER